MSDAERARVVTHWVASIPLNAVCDYLRDLAGDVDMLPGDYRSALLLQVARLLEEKL